MTGSENSNYEIYADIEYADDSSTRIGASCSSGTHDFELAEFIFDPSKPVKNISFACVFQGHDGEVMMDNVVFQEKLPGTEISWNIPEGKWILFLIRVS